MMLVIENLEVLELKAINTGDIRVNLEHGEGVRVPRELFLERFDVVFVDVGIPQDVDEFASLQPTDLSEQAGQEGVTGDVEGDAKTHVAGSLVGLATQFAVG